MLTMTTRGGIELHACKVVMVTAFSMDIKQHQAQSVQTTHHCVDFLRCQPLVHHGMVVTSHMGEGWGTGRAGA